ncbi:hypothetical protein PVAP13_6NG369401 [Panicum virgatum]|uniref:Uncharacterized protein n=1 Tax=Panicum virgatum TaxID=38727 RepID=A0A8T0R4X0_PANVG|nr:hypothetical protein PVAP13_6NG369401 [Panicum virgatum]
MNKFFSFFEFCRMFLYISQFILRSPIIRKTYSSFTGDIGRRSPAVALHVQEESTGRLAPRRRVVGHPQPALLLRPGLDHELRPRASAGAAPAAEPPVVHVPHDVDHLPVGQHGGAVAPEAPPHPPHLRHLLPVDAHPQQPVPAPARVHGHLVLVAAVAEPAPRDVRRRRAPQLLAPADEARGAARDGGAEAEAAGELARRGARAEEERELGVGHDGEAVVALGLRGRGRVLGLRGVPVHADGRAGAGDERPAPPLLLQQHLAAPRRRRRRAVVVECDGDAGRSRGAAGPRDPDEHLLARGQDGPVHGRGRRLQRAVERAAARDGGRRDADGAVAEAGQLPHCSAAVGNGDSTPQRPRILLPMHRSLGGDHRTAF